MKQTSNKFHFAVLVALAIVFASACGVAAMDQININTDPVEKLMQLERVGPQYAQRIVEHRELYGPFETPEAIMNVKGIGPKTWEANKERIVI